MSSVDSRIVTMKFDNAQFEKGASQTMGTIEKLKSSLNFTGAGKGLETLGGSAVDADAHVSKLSAGFVALGTMAVTAIANITTKLMTMGTEMYKSMSGINAMKDGFSDYELKIGATQTIMAGTGENIGEVTKYLKELDIYADKTIYSLSDMTSNIGKFTNAGVKLPVAVEAMKGISNVAALSGANAEEAARAMYNLGQAIGNGAVKLMDWKSVELANMGTKEFKEQLIDAAVATGSLTRGVDGVAKTVKGKVVDFKTFNGTLSEGWLTSEALTTSLGKYADETTDIGKRAYAAATEVKTFSMMMETLSAAAGTGWTDTFEILIGNLPEATELFTGITNAIGGWIGASADARNKLLGDWKELGGRTDLIEGIKNIFKALGAIITPIKEAFRDIFPRTTGKQLAELTEKFREFTSHLKISGETADNIKSIFKGIFGIFSVAVQIIKGVGTAIGAMFTSIASAASGGSGGFLAFSASLGDMVSGFATFISKSGVITKAFSTIGTAIGTVIGFVGQLVGAFSSLFTGKDNSFIDTLSTKFAEAGPIIDSIKAKIQGFLDVIRGMAGGIASLFGFGGAEESASGVEMLNASLEDTTTLIDVVRAAWKKLVDAWTNSKASVGGVLGKVGEAFGNIRDKIKETYGNVGLQDILSIINTGFFIGLFVQIRKFATKIGDYIDSVSGVLEQLTDNLKAMEQNVKAKAILAIGIALLALAVAVVILARIDVKDLGKAMGALAVMLTILSVGFKVLEKESKKLSKSSGQMLATGAALILLAIALVILAKAMEMIAGLDNEELAKGLGSVAILMGGMIGAAMAFDKAGGAKDLVQAAAAILILAAALMLMAAAIKVWDEIDASTLADGIWKIGVVLAVLGDSMKWFPKEGEMVKAAAAILILSAALILLAVGLEKMGRIGIWQLAKGIGAMAISINIMVSALKRAEKSKDGSVALIIAAGAIFVLAVALEKLGKMPLKDIAKAIGALIIVLAVLGVTAQIMTQTGTVVMLQALGIALLIIGAAMLTAGVGMAAFAVGLSILSTLGVGALTILVEMFPLIGEQIALAIVAWIKIIGDSAPIIGEAFVKIVTAIIDAAREIIPLLPPLITDALDAWLKVMKEAIPKMAKAALEWLIAILEEINDNIYKIVTLGGQIIVKFLKGISNNIEDIVDAGAELLTKFLRGVAKNLPDVIDAGFDVIVAFIEGTADAIDEHKDELNAAGKHLGAAIIDGAADAIGDTGWKVVTALTGVFGVAIAAAKKKLDSESPSKVFYRIGEDINRGAAMGIDDTASMVEDSTVGVAEAAIAGMKSTMSQIADVVDSDLNMNPVIAPVLDLSSLRKGAAQANGLFGTGVSFNHATGLSNDYLAMQASGAGSPAQTPETIIQFEQNNYSPKELSSVDIYRQTKNQLSLAKGALTA